MSNATGPLAQEKSGGLTRRVLDPLLTVPLRPSTPTWKFLQRQLFSLPDDDEVDDDDVDDDDDDTTGVNIKSFTISRSGSIL